MVERCERILKHTSIRDHSMLKGTHNKLPSEHDCDDTNENYTNEYKITYQPEYPSRPHCPHTSTSKASLEIMSRSSSNMLAP